MARRSKRWKQAREQIDSDRLYPLDQAVGLLASLPAARFDETVELAMMLDVDPRHADQNVRGMIDLPHGIGKTVRVAVFAQHAQADAARAAGADIVGAEDLAQEVAQGKIDFDRCIATPAAMVIVGKLGKVLGPRGLMPNPRLGTVTDDVATAVQAAKGGRVNFRVDRAGIIHAGVGKRSFDPAQIEENCRSFIGAVIRAKPSGVKGRYLKAIHLSTTMGPGISLTLSS